MPPKKAAAAAKPAPKTKASAKSSAASTKTTKAPAKKSRAAAEPKAPAKATTKTTTTKRKASEISEADPPSKTATKAAPKKTAAAKPAAPKKAAVPKKAPAKKAAPKTKTKKATPAKRTVTEEVEEDDNPESEPPAKRAKKAETLKPAPKVKAATKPAALKKALPEINTPPTTILDVFVFGEGSAGELGLGVKSSDGKKVVDVTRPRLNERLSAKNVGVVQIAVGGMHCAALTKDNKILTWGVNDCGALGRETPQEGKMKDLPADGEEDSDSDEDGSGLNPSEAEPREVDMNHFPEGTKITSLYASDNATFALTTTGAVYGWGTFRDNEGTLGFRPAVKYQHTPMLIPELKSIVEMACGTNHVLARNNKGKVFAWGAGEQSQLARRVVSRTAIGALVPREFGLQRKSIVHIGCGDYHSFAVEKNGEVYAWGLNTFGETGVEKESEDDNTVSAPTKVENLKEYNIKQIVGGAHHTLSCTETGQVLFWGRIDNHRGGMDVDEMPKDKLFFDEHRKPRFLKEPIVLPELKGKFVATATDTCIVITEDGKAFSWGFSTNYQTGQGTDDDVEEATHIDNTAVRGKKLVFAGLGGQFGIVGGIHEDAVTTNGI